MASGDPVVQILDVMPNVASFARPRVRLGGSTPAEVVDVWRFADGAEEFLDFRCALRKYGGGGLTFTLPWSATSATTGGVVWAVAIRRIADDAEDIDAAHTYDFNQAAADTAPSASGEVSYPTVTFTDGADMDSWADGELAIVRVKRVVGDAGDDMTGDAELWGLVGKET